MVLADMYALIDSPTADYGLALRIIQPAGGPSMSLPPAGPAT
jgi:hypothetical protein